MDEAIRRLNMYAAAGADVMYADALMSKEDIAKVARSVKKPLIVNMGLGMRSRNTTPLMSPKELQDLGVGGVSAASFGAGAGAVATGAVTDRIADGAGTAGAGSAATGWGGAKNEMVWTRRGQFAGTSRSASNASACRSNAWAQAFCR